MKVAKLRFIQMQPFQSTTFSIAEIFSLGKLCQELPSNSTAATSETIVERIVEMMKKTRSNSAGERCGSSRVRF